MWSQQSSIDSIGTLSIAQARSARVCTELLQASLPKFVRLFLVFPQAEHPLLQISLLEFQVMREVVLETNDFHYGATANAFQLPRPPNCHTLSATESGPSGKAIGSKVARPLAVGFGSHPQHGLPGGLLFA